MKTMQFVYKSLALSLTASALLALTACGKSDGEAPVNSTAPAASTAVAAAPATAPATPPVATENALGKSVYNKTCALCHAAGVAGAPKPGDQADWGPRIAQGNETLYKHAIEGFTGAKGMMPARGGGSTLKDDEVKAAVDHMVSLSK